MSNEKKEVESYGRPNPSKLDCGVAEGARGKERAYAEWHRLNGQPLRRKYRAR